MNMSMMDLGESKQNPPSDGLPPEMEAFSFQIAGHKPGRGMEKCGILKHKNGAILKQLFDGDLRSTTELLFYESVFNCQSDPIFCELVKFLPAFRGTLQTNMSGKDIKFLSLEDICEGFQKPSIIDIKIGSKTYDDYASEEKIMDQKTKFLFGEALGIRILGMKAYDDEKKIHISQTKIFFRQLSPDSMFSALQLYLTHNKQINAWVLCAFLHKLHDLDVWFSKQRKFKFIASSILLVYEGILSSWNTWSQNNKLDAHITSPCDTTNSAEELHVSRGDICTKCSDTLPVTAEFLNTACDICGLCKTICSKVLTNCSLFRVAMIDFAHTFPSEELDSNYILGLHKLMDYFRKLLKLQLEN